MHISNLTKAGRFLYRLGLFKNHKFYPEFAPDTLCSDLKVRVIHPLGPFILAYAILEGVFTSGVPTTIDDIKNNFCIF